MGMPAEKNTALPNPDALSVARQVLATEIAGLQSLHDSLNASIGAAVNLLSTTHGRIIVTGMGKSGHIARKIAATFASTGAPAQFVHPGEASHGDLGMITRDDAVIALSNSGEADELGDVIAYARRYGIKLLAITAVETSTLARAADLVLLLPQAREACSLGLAPTTSTTMMLALGDALAVALLEKRGFGPEDYAVFHPGGTIGRALLRVEALMHGENLPLAGLETPVADVILTMTAGRFGCAGIVDKDGKLAGIITDGDLRRHLDAAMMDQPAQNIMTAKPLTVPPQMLAGETLRLMTERPAPINVLFVVEEGKPVGILHLHDLIRAGVV
jgi:arabinose-5-phosphate isomerase